MVTNPEGTRMMFDTLIESRRRKDRRSGGTAVSVVLHTVLIVLAVVMTAEAKDRPAHAPPPPEVIYRAVVKLTEQPKPVTRRHAPVELPPTEHIFRDVVLPPTIPTTLPPIDPTAPVVDPRDFNGVGVPEGAVSDAGGAPDHREAYYAFQV